MSACKRKSVCCALLLLADDDLWGLESCSKKKKRKHRCWIRSWIFRRENQERNTMFSLQKELELEDTKEFMSMLRLDVETFYWLLGKVTPFIQKQDTNYRKCIGPEERLSLTLTYLASGGTNAPLSRQFRMGRSTVGKVIRDTCEGIFNCLQDEYLTTATDMAHWKAAAKEYEVRWQFPNCFGAIDGKHIRIKQPNNSGSIFFNYKSCFSLVLLAIVSANYEFSFIDVGAEGRVADGGIWKCSAFKIALDEGHVHLPAPTRLPEGEIAVPYVLVADDAFPLGPTLLKPYARRDLSYSQRIFNYRLSRARRLSENAFGILANRFRIFLSAIERPPETVQAMVLAATALHNMLRRRCPNLYMPPASVDQEDANHNVIPGDWRDGPQLPPLGDTTYRNPTKYAKAVRDIYAEHFVGAGAVPWQDGKI